ncbi:MAG: DNA starvation/stationary phase protection protein [Alphaproteobacteria bacterium]|nr:DNA starvation/stationary phase protection protein [Alphaproteobacteria bacterium]
MAKTTVSKTKAVSKTKTVSVKVDPAMAMAKQLALVLSDTYVLAVKTHGYHWNVMGPQFASLHAFFGQQYDALIKAADEIAERIRALGIMPDGSMDSFLQNTVIPEAGTKMVTANAMLKDLLDSHQLVHDRLADAEELADAIDDVVSQDLMVGRMAAHDKDMWMIRSHVA